MRLLFILVFSFFLISCEKNNEPLKEGEVILSLSQESYEVGDSVEIFLIKMTDKPVYSHPPSDWVLSKLVNDTWEAIAPINIPAVWLPPNEFKERKTLVFTRIFQNSGLYRYQLFLTWDKEGNRHDSPGWIISDTFEIK
jgi:hypothetical protein